jgi:SNF2 family DNA or RNA helicase
MTECFNVCVLLIGLRLMVYYETLCLQILADAMGLGKTVMTIALILSNPRGEFSNCIKGDTRYLGDRATRGYTSTSSVRGGTLVVCPMSLLGQWKVSILIYY